MAKSPGAATAARPCPICGKPATAADRPFCSRRCADIDLHRWLSGSYRIAAAPDDEAEGKPPGEAESGEGER